MVKILDTAATNHYLNQLIKNVQDRLIIVSPYLKLNDSVKDLLKDLDYRKREIRVVYGKSELAPQEMNWLQELTSVRTFYSKNLHAKCYLNEREAILTSMNLYEFSQVNNIELGIWFTKDDEPQLYSSLYEEVDRIIVHSESVRLTAVPDDQPDNSEPVVDSVAQGSGSRDTAQKLSTSKIARSLGIKTAELNKRLVEFGYVVPDGDRFQITQAGRDAGGEPKHSARFGAFIVWPPDLSV